MKPIFLALSLLLTSHLVYPASPKVIYGSDNRLDTAHVQSQSFLRLAESTAAQIPNSAITIRGTMAEVDGQSLMSWTPRGMSHPVCEKERFSAQPTASNCSGFFVADKILVTAGHCMMSEMDCRNFSWVTNYKVVDENDTAVSVDAKDVYKCAKVIKVGLRGGLDFAVIELDKSLDGQAVKIAKTAPLVGTPLVMIGHPSGLPQKITDGAQITSVSGNTFKTNLDAFGGNSGSAVFNAESGELLGILVNGNTDYRHNHQLNCSEVNLLSDEQAGEGVSSFEQFISYL